MTLQGIVETCKFDAVAPSQILLCCRSELTKLFTDEHLIVTRVLLGLFESGFFPAATYLLTTWYCRFEVQTRMAVFFSAASLSSAFSGLLAAAIVNMDGIAGLGGWRWIFIIEGLGTVAISFLVLLFVPEYPERTKILSGAEKEHLLEKLRRDKGDQTLSFKGVNWLAIFTDWKIWLP